MEALVVVLLFGFIFLVIPRRKDVYGKIIAFKKKQIPVYVSSSSMTSEPLSFEFLPSVPDVFTPVCFIRIQNPVTHEKTTIKNIPSDLFERIKSKQCINIVLDCRKFILNGDYSFHQVISEE